MRVVLIFILACSVTNVSGQETDYKKFKGEQIKAGVNIRLTQPYFKEYGYPYLEEYVAINRFTSLPDSPEKILQQEYSNSDADTATNFLVLRHKLTFTDNHNEISIIKYTQFTDSLAVGNYSIQAINKNGSWSALNGEKYNDIEYAISNITADEFWALTKRGKLDENDLPISSDLLEDLKDTDGILNLYKLTVYLEERARKGKEGLQD